MNSVVFLLIRNFQRRLLTITERIIKLRKHFDFRILFQSHILSSEFYLRSNSNLKLKNAWFLNLLKSSNLLCSHSKLIMKNFEICEES